MPWPLGKVIVAVILCATVVEFAVAEEQFPVRMTGHLGGVRDIAFSHDNKMLASGSNDYSVRLWNLETCECARVIWDHQSAVTSICFTEDDAFLISGTYDGAVTKWSVATGEKIESFQLTAGPIRKLLCLRNESAVYVCSGQEVGKVNLGETSYSRLFTAATAVSHVDLQGGRALLCFLKKDAATEVRSLANVDLVPLQTPLRRLTGTLSPTGSLVVTAETGRGVELWVAATGDRVRQYAYWDGESISNLDLSADERLIATTGQDQCVTIRATRTGQILLRKQVFEEGTGEAVRFSSDGTCLAAAGGYGRGELFLWKGREWEVKR